MVVDDPFVELTQTVWMLTHYTTPLLKLLALHQLFPYNVKQIIIINIITTAFLGENNSNKITLQ